ncbi:MAG: HAMP domain-containing histidine kinase [Rickettsiales bacterium]|nr:HAMP domain-containing histidine kinase [Rickettsiales bacterium]
MQEKITDSLNVKEEFLNKLNHELRIPLSVMINTSDGIYEMWDRLSDKDKKKYLKDIVDNRKRFENYTSSILDLADLVQKRFKLNITPNVDLVKLSKAVIDEANSLIIDINKNLKIKLVKNTKSAIADCDEKRIQQVLINLLSNAVKYSDHGIIKVSIKTVKDKIAISVSDQGVGIPNNEKSKIFTPFFEGIRTKSPAEGRGLGLSIAQQIVILHKGYIKVENNEPQGSMFTFLFPCKIYSNSNENKYAYDLVA